MTLPSHPAMISCKFLFYCSKLFFIDIWFGSGNETNEQSNGELSGNNRSEDLEDIDPMYLVECQMEAVDKYKADAELRCYNEFFPTSTHYIPDPTTHRRLAKHLWTSFGFGGSGQTDILPQVMLCWVKVHIRNGGDLIQGALAQARSQ